MFYNTKVSNVVSHKLCYAPSNAGTNEVDLELEKYI